MSLVVVVAPLAVRLAHAQQAPTEHQIVATVHHLRNDRGFVRMSIYNSASRFLQPGGGFIVCRTAISNRSATCTFRALQPGATYALAFGHDENDNGRVDQGFLGIPLEGYGFSNDARPSLSAPGFGQCQFVFRGGTHAMRMVAQY